MAGIALHHPHGEDFDLFLYAPVGEDINGNVVTVLSAFARLGFDPWLEAAEVGSLSGDAARIRLSATLSKFKDVPALLLDHSSIARQLTGFLPERSIPVAVKLAGPRALGQSSVSVGTIFATVMILLALLKIFISGEPGSGE